VRFRCRRRGKEGKEKEKERGEGTRGGGRAEPGGPGPLEGGRAEYSHSLIVPKRGEGKEKERGGRDMTAASLARSAARFISSVFVSVPYQEKKKEEEEEKKKEGKRIDRSSAACRAA